MRFVVRFVSILISLSHIYALSYANKVAQLSIFFKQSPNTVTIDMKLNGLLLKCSTTSV